MACVQNILGIMVIKTLVMILIITQTSYAQRTDTGPERYAADDLTEASKKIVLSSQNLPEYKKVALEQYISALQHLGRARNQIFSISNVQKKEFYLNCWKKMMNLTSNPNIPESGYRFNCSPLKSLFPIEKFKDQNSQNLISRERNCLLEWDRVSTGSSDKNFLPKFKEYFQFYGSAADSKMAQCPFSPNPSLVTPNHPATTTK